MLKHFFWTLIGICLVSSCFANSAVTIGVVVDGKEVSDSPYISGLEKEVQDLLEGEYEVSFEYYFGDWSKKGVEQALNDALNNSTVDLIVAGGGITGELAIEQQGHKVPILIPAFVPGRFPNRDWKRFYQENGIAVIQFAPIEPSNIQLLYEVSPYKKLAVIADETILEPAIKMGAVEAEVIYISVTDSTSPILKKLNELDFDAAYLLPTWRLSDREIQEMMQQLNAKKIPSLSGVGEEQLDLGVLMTTIPRVQVQSVSRALALNIQEILLHSSQADLSYAFPDLAKIIMNQTVMEELKIYPSWDFLSEVRFVNIPSPNQEKVLSFCESAEIAIRNNLDLNAERFFVLGGAELVKRARSFLGPRVDSRLEARFIDADQARLGGGRTPQSALSGGLLLEQQLYDDELWSNYTVERWLQSSRLYDLDTFRLDVTFAASIAYLRVLQIRAEELIAKENLDLSRANLNRAIARVETGEANRSEEYRWESEIAKNQDSLARIRARVELAETEYNRLLNRPLHTPVLIRNMGLWDPDFLFNFNQINTFFENEMNVQLFKECMIALGRFQSPEIKAIDSQLGAQSRRYLAAERAFYIPKFFLSGEIEDIFAKGGAGSRFPPGTRADNFDARLVIDLRYPIYTSGQRRADRRRASYELDNLATERMSTIQRVDQTVVNAVDNMQASYQGIFWSEKGVVAAEKNLEIVENSYTRGVVSIVDLIDAQNASFVAKTDASNSLYDFLIDFMSLQRAIGKFSCFMSDQEMKCIKEECTKYLSSNKKRADHACYCE